MSEMAVLATFRFGEEPRRLRQYVLVPRIPKPNHFFTDPDLIS